MLSAIFFRFCAISNSFIKRNVEGTPSSVSAAQFQSGVGVGLSKSGLTSQKIAAPQSLQQKGEKYSSKVGFPSPNLVKDVKSENTGLKDPVNQAPTNKEKVPSMAANKKKVQNGKGSSGTEGSLANFWSRASAKSKASCPAETSSGWYIWVYAMQFFVFGCLTIKYKLHMNINLHLIYLRGSGTLFL